MSGAVGICKRERGVAFIAGTGNDTGRAAGLEMRAVAPIWACQATRAAADWAVLGEFSMSRWSFWCN
jgi:hypothetical protein